jgi:MFS family permease
MAGRVQTATLVVASRTALVSSVPVGVLGLTLGRLPFQLLASGEAITLMGVAQAALALVGGQLADRWSRSVVAVVGAVGTTLAWLVMAAWGAHPVVAVGAAAGVGAGVGLVVPATSGLIQELVPDRRLLRVNAALLAASVAGTFVVSTLGLLLIAVPPDPAGLLVLAALLGAAAVVLALLVHTRHRRREPAGDPDTAARGARVPVHDGAHGAADHGAHGAADHGVHGAADHGVRGPADGGGRGARARFRWWMWALVAGLGVLAAIAAVPDAVASLPARFPADPRPELIREIAVPVAVVGAAVLLYRLPVRRPMRLTLLVCLGMLPALLVAAGSANWWQSTVALILASTTGAVFATLSETMLELHVPAEVISRTVGLVLFVQRLLPVLAQMLALSGHRGFLVVLPVAVVVSVGVALAVPGIRRLPNQRTVPERPTHRQHA